jgi:DNA-binding NtrC family response regulator
MERVVLLIEDDPGFREICREVLTENGFVIFECESIKGAKAVLEAHFSVITHVICDDNLTDGQGGRTIRAICDILNIPCLLISGSQADYIDIVKPPHWPELISRLDM